MKKAISVLKYVLSLLLAIVLLYFAFRNIDLQEFISKSKEVDYSWVVVSILLSMVAYYARAYRWNLLLKPLGFPKLNVHRTNLAILIGYLANLAFPRLGEVTRCAMLKRSDDVPVATSFGTVITERIIDMITLLVLILLTLLVEYERLMTFMSNMIEGLEGVSGIVWKSALVLLIGGIAFLALAYFLYQKSVKVRSFINSLIEGLLSLRKVQNLTGFIISTLVLWVTYYFMSYLIVFSIPETSHLSWMVGIMLLITGGLALAVPVQGGIGTYHAFISAMLLLYGVDQTTGVFLATLLHSSQIVAIAGFGGIALLISFLIQKKKPDAETTESDE
ncbi:MAG: flippase-like domain-containing protein [Cyclobacteriaceae bacterium]